MYPCLEKMSDLRDHNTTVQIGEINTNNEQSTFGHKKSLIVDLPNFDLINVMVPDYMHCVAEGLLSNSHFMV